VTLTNTTFNGSWPGISVITLPAEVDYCNAEDVGELVVRAFALRASAVILDMTFTTFCDSAGLGKMALAHRLASAHGADLRIVLRPGPTARLFTRTRMDQVLSIFPTLDAALKAETDTSIGDP
jgi:anti-anti-sigma factor